LPGSLTANIFKRIFTVYVFAYSFFFASRPLTDPDFWFHLKTGQYILQKRVIPKTDLFSFTNFGRPWVTHEWLSEAIFYAVYSRLGLYALIFLFWDWQTGVDHLIGTAFEWPS